MTEHSIDLLPREACGVFAKQCKALIRLDRA